MGRWNNVQRQFVVLTFLAQWPGGRFTYSEIQARSGVYDPDEPNTESVSDDVAVLRRVGLVTVTTPRHGREHHVSPPTKSRRHGVVQLRERVTKQADFHLTWAEHRALSALRAAHPATSSPSPVPGTGKFVDLLRIVREAEEATSSLTVADFVRKTGLSAYVVRSRLRDLRDLAAERDGLPEGLVDLLKINEHVDWTRAYHPDGSDDEGTHDDIVSAIADRKDHWMRQATDDSTLTGVGLGRVGLFPYSIAETVDRLKTIEQYAHTVEDDGERYFLDEARWKLHSWLSVIAPSQVGAAPAE